MRDWSFEVPTLMAACNSGGHVARRLRLGLDQCRGVDQVEALALDDLQRDGGFAVEPGRAGAVFEGEADFGQIAQGDTRSPLVLTGRCRYRAAR